jgi:hypothetical protein
MAVEFAKIASNLFISFNDTSIKKLPPLWGFNINEK